MLSMPKNPLSSLNGLFYPKSIAVIGASENVSKIGGFIFSELLKLKNTNLYPVNIKNKQVQGKTCYNKISDLPKEVDLAIIAIPGKFVIDSVEDCAKKGIKNIVIISAGFKETGEEGKLREEELKIQVKKHNLNIIGPNCLGILNTDFNLNASFAKEIPHRGDIGLVSQSGAIIDALLDWSFEENVGFSKVVSIGNMAGVDELDMLKYLREDSKTKSIVFYMESLENGEEFAKELKKTTKEKPVIIIKPGNSKAAQKAIGSHTGSLAQDGKLVEKLIEENNGIFVKTIDQLQSMLISLSTPLPKTNSIAILTNAGGPGVIATDMLETTSLELAKITNNSKNKLKEFLPDEGSVKNPIDLLGDATSPRYENAIKVLCEDKNVGSILVLLTPQIMTDNANIAEVISNIKSKTNKPIFTAFLGGKELRESFEIFKENKVANFSSPNKAIYTIDKLYNYNNFNYNDKLKTPKEIDTKKIDSIKKELKKYDGLLPYEISKKVLKNIGVEMPKKQIIESRDDIFSINLNPHKKYVLKADNILHKKENSAIENNITKYNFEEKVEKMFSNLEKQGIHPTLMLEENVEGVETIIGLKKNKDLGSFIMFGTGGSNVSIYNDIEFAKAPITHKKAKEIISKTSISKLLKGYRGDNPVNIEKLIDIMIKISYLQYYYEEIQEVDFNPVICNEKNCELVDVKLVLSNKK